MANSSTRLSNRSEIYAGTHAPKLFEVRDEPTDSPDWVDQITTWHTPKGDLREVFLKSTRKKPGYHKEYMLKEPADLKRLLSLPYTPYPFSADAYWKADEAGREHDVAGCRSGIRNHDRDGRRQ